VAAAVAIAVVAAVAFSCAGDGGNGQQGASAPTTAPRKHPTTTHPTTTTTVHAVPAADAAGDEPVVLVGEAPKPDPKPKPVLEDGRHAAFLTELDVAGSTVEFDVVQFLRGQDAERAYAERHPGEPSGVDNDYLLLNDSPRLRRLPVMPGAMVTVVFDPAARGAPGGGCCGPNPIALADLPAYLGPEEEDGHLGYSLFWLTVHDDTVVAIEEQFLP
jgi:hypothetical protein